MSKPFGMDLCDTYILPTWLMDKLSILILMINKDNPSYWDVYLLCNYMAVIKKKTASH